MNTIKRVAFFASALLACWCAEAQYTFSAQIVVTGNCFSGTSSMAMNNIRQMVNDLNARFKAVPLTREECMAMSQQFAGEMTVYEFNEYGCSIKVIVTPCVCTNCQEEATPGPDQGGSFNSANAGSEVSDWADDVDKRRTVLDQQGFIPPSGIQTGTGDQRFDDALRKSLGTFELPSNAVALPENFELLANMENVNRYLSMCSDLAKRYIEYPDPDHLVGWFHDEFKKVSGFDLDAIMNKLPSQRTEAERQALYDYQVFRAKLADKMIKDLQPYIELQEEQRVYEMAVLSEDCYGDSNHKLIKGTNYMAVNSVDLLQGSPMQKWADLIERCNRYDPGFNAQLYYNTVTGGYSVAFEGSNLHPIANITDFIADWKDCNFKQGFGGIPVQYLLAKMIADAMPKGVPISFTGHSLGGGLASVAGAVSGAPTYTFNPEGVNNNIINWYGIRDKVDAGDYNIKAFQAQNDMLTSVQEGFWKVPAVTLAIGVSTAYAGGKVIVEKMSNSNESLQNTMGTITEATVAATSKAGGLIIEAAKGNIASPAIGDKYTVECGGKHEIAPMIDYFDGARGHLTAWQQSIYNAGHGNEQQTQDHILIVWPDE